MTFRTREISHSNEMQPFTQNLPAVILADGKVLVAGNSRGEECVWDPLGLRDRFERQAILAVVH